MNIYLHKSIYLFLIITVLSYGQTNAQENDRAATDEKTPSDTVNQHYNHWSLELSGGLTSAKEGYTEGYGQNLLDLGQAQLHARYMINDRFGVQFGGGYHRFHEGKRTKDFSTDLFDFNVEGVANLRNLFNLQDWTQRLGLLLHGGGGYGTLKYDALDIGLFSDNVSYLKFGLTPQLRLSNHWALMGDFSFFKMIRQDYAIDGHSSVPNNTEGLRSTVFDLSLGVMYYLGSYKKHLDWKNPVEKNELDKLEERVAALENKDVPKSDFEFYTFYMGDTATTKGPSSLKLEYLTVQFPFDGQYPQKYSLTEISYVREFMMERKDSEILITGYADEIGNTAYNQRLSEKRAQNVKNILVASGIDGNRIETRGQGEDDSVDKDSKEARQLVRKVKFRLK